MKYIILTFLFILSLYSQLVGNPIIVKYMSELYFEDDNWTIELAHTAEMGGWFFQNLDNLRLVSTTDTAQFNSGISLDDVNIILVTQDSLQAPLSINKNGDSVQLQEGGGDDWYFIDEIYFGDYPNSNVNAPFEGQSIVSVEEIGYEYAKDNIPSLGSNPYYANTRGTFSGYVFDQQQNPISNARIRFYYYNDIYTNQNGYFENNYMCGMNYNVIIYVDDIAMLDTLITIEPDSTTYCEFYLDLYSIDEEQLQSRQLRLTNYPNPFIESTTISLLATSLCYATPGQAKIIIYNIKGQLVKEFKIQNYKFKINEIEWGGKSDDGVLQPPGFYFYSLEVDGKKIKTNKMIMVR
ncbi:MAG: T9SS type A sorting domain-containing protein [Candidatus Cloacimonetes bacterium]|nr:T9SS type A sorting domain-containing protein [Candidatus Cloacimonadota bacterium]